TRLQHVRFKVVQSTHMRSVLGRDVLARLDQQDYDCYLEVENVGPQIPPELLAGMFNSMVSARTAGAGHAHFGLGLYIVRLISQFHGGSVSAHNLDNPSGVLFRIKLPVLLV
ncbi:MAG TPA: hypothetical protein EYQ12_03850, partial [Oceanospirillaceae bacterium]|nr:hypothetical protein [Oceanospirillaceae bacterium]